MNANMITYEPAFFVLDVAMTWIVDWLGECLCELCHFEHFYKCEANRESVNEYNPLGLAAGWVRQTALISVIVIIVVIIPRPHQLFQVKLLLFLFVFLLLLSGEWLDDMISVR